MIVTDKIEPKIKSRGQTDKDKSELMDKNEDDNNPTSKTKKIGSER